MTDQPPPIPDPPAPEAVSYVVAPPPRDRWAHRRTEPRPFALLWLTFLLSAAALTLGAVGAAAIPSGEMYRHATRILFLLAALGVTIFWPMLRLCQARPDAPRRAVLLDLLVLLLPLHFITWPQCFAWMAQWSVPTAAAVASTLTAWSLFIGALLSLVFLTEPAHEPQLPPTARRSAWMVAILALVILGPLAALAGAPNLWAFTSPVGLTLDLVRDQQTLRVDTLPTAAHWWAIGITASIAFLGWVLLGILAPWAHSPAQPPADPPLPPPPADPLADGPREA